MWQEQNGAVQPPVTQSVVTQPPVTQSPAPTDAQMAGPIAALGADLEPVIESYNQWSKTVRAGFGYPASGPEDLAKAAGR